MTVQQTDPTKLAMAALVVGCLMAGAYWLGSQQQPPVKPEARPAVDKAVVDEVQKPLKVPAVGEVKVAEGQGALPKVAALPPGAQVPPGHPPFDAGSPKPGVSGGRIPPGNEMGMGEAKVIQVMPPDQGDVTKQGGDGQPAVSGGQVGGGSAKFTHFRVGNRNVKDMLVDGSYLWVGTSGGVIRYDTRSDEYRMFDVRGGNLLANGVFHVGRLGQKVVVGTYGGGFSLYDPGTEKWETFNIPDGLADPFVYDTLMTRGGDFWIATWSGANRVKGGDLKDRSKWETFTVENTQGGLPNDWVYGLAEGKNGEVWLATEGGLGRYLNGQWTRWTHADGLGVEYESVKGQNPFENDPAKVSSHHARQKQEQGLGQVTTAYNPNYIISMVVDQQGHVWCGTWGAGLARFDGQKWTNYAMANGLPSNYIFMLHVDGKGRLWAGTSNGLARMEENGTFTVMTTDDGLFSNNVFSMAMSGDGWLWVGSFGGVAKIRAE